MDEYSSLLFELLLRSGIEMILLLAIAWILVYKTSLLNRLHALGSERIIGFFLFLLIWTGIHLVDRWQYFYPQKISFYPMTRFAMYQHGIPQDLVQAYKFQITYADNTTEEVNLTEVFDAVGLPSFSTRMRILAKDLENHFEKPERYRRASQEIKSFMQAYRSWRANELKKDVRTYSIQFIRTEIPTEEFFSGDADVSESILLEEENAT